jgi:hypothetical protein
MGFQFVVIFIDSFMDDVIYIRDVEVCVERMICYIPGCICYVSENFGLGSPSSCRKYLFLRCSDQTLYALFSFAFMLHSLPTYYQ